MKINLLSDVIMFCMIKIIQEDDQIFPSVCNNEIKTPTHSRKETTERTFLQHADAPEMAKSNPQAMDYPYPTTNTSPLTTYHALVVCEALRRVCPCDDDRDAKEDDCDSDVLTSDQFS